MQVDRDLICARFGLSPSASDASIRAVLASSEDDQIRDYQRRFFPELGIAEPPRIAENDVDLDERRRRTPMRDFPGFA